MAKKGIGVYATFAAFFYISQRVGEGESKDSRHACNFFGIVFRDKDWLNKLFFMDSCLFNEGAESGSDSVSTHSSLNMYGEMLLHLSSILLLFIWNMVYETKDILKNLKRYIFNPH